MLSSADGEFCSELDMSARFANLERAISCALPHSAALKWSRRFSKVMPVGFSRTAMEEIVRDFALFVLADQTMGVLTKVTMPEQRAAIERVVELFETRCTEDALWDEAEIEALKKTHVSLSRWGAEVRACDARQSAANAACGVAARLASSTRSPADLQSIFRQLDFMHRRHAYAVALEKDPSHDEHFARDSDSWYVLRTSARDVASRKVVVMQQLYGEAFIRLVKQHARREFGFGARIKRFLAFWRPPDGTRRLIFPKSTIAIDR